MILSISPTRTATGAAIIRTFVFHADYAETLDSLFTTELITKGSPTCTDIPRWTLAAFVEVERVVEGSVFFHRGIRVLCSDQLLTRQFPSSRLRLIVLGAFSQRCGPT